MIKFLHRISQTARKSRSSTSGNQFGRLGMAAKRVKTATAAFDKAYESDISWLREFFQRMTFLSLSLAFLFGMIVGGILSSPPSVFIIGTLVLGFPAAIAYGVALGLTPILSALLAVGVNCFVAYAALRSIRAVETDKRVAPYVDNIRKKYDATSRRLLSHAGKVGVAGSLAIFSFLIGWWVAVLVAYILDMEEGTAMKGIIVGNLAGAFMSLAIFQGLLITIPHPGVVSLIFVMIFVVSAFLARRASRQTSVHDGAGTLENPIQHDYGK
ncbi:MAG: small multi-drug export protein [archaeon]